MSRRSIIVFAVITLIAIAVAWNITARRAPQKEVARAEFLPDLAAHINEVARMEIRSASDQVVIARDGNRWVIANRGNYPALFENVKGTVLALADLKTLEPKTQDPEMYSRIGVEDIEAKGATSRLLTVHDKDGKALASLIVGNVRDPKSGPVAGGTRALYVRRAGEPQAFLVAGELPGSARPVDWMDRSLFDIQSERIHQIVTENPGEAPISMTRPGRKITDLKFDDLPEGYSLKSQATLTALASALSDLRFDDVSAAADATIPPDAVTTTIRTFDGLVAKATTTKDDGQDQTRFEFSYDPSGVVPDEPAEPQAKAEPTADKPAAPEAATTEGSADTASGAEKSAEAKTEGAPATTPAAGTPPAQTPKKSVEDEVRELNEKVKGWVYVLPEYKAQMLSRKRDDLIAKKDETPPASPTAPPGAPPEMPLDALPPGMGGPSPMPFPEDPGSPPEGLQDAPPPAATDAPAENESDPSVTP